MKWDEKRREAEMVGHGLSALSTLCCKLGMEGGVTEAIAEARRLAFAECQRCNAAAINEAI